MWFRDFFTGRFSGLSKAVPLQRSTTNETQDTARTLDKHFDNNLDDMIETGSDGTEEKNLEKSVQSQRPMSLRNSIMGRKFQILIAMAILFGLILILGSLLVISRHRSEGSQQMSNPSGNANSAWHDTATWSGGLSPYPSPTTSGQTPASPPSYLYPRPSPSGASFPSVESQLSAVIDTSTLQNSQTPLGIAYKWITQQDDLSSTTKSYPTVVQRFALAAFYFATGGGRTQATWNVCSAVPANVVKDRNSFSTKCVFGEGIEYGQVVCAGSQAFLECPEYYAGSPAPTDPKKRWLSDTSECDWYGVSCNRDGIVEELALPQNGLKGTLLPELDLLSDMKSLDLSSNTLTGTLPDWQALEYMEQVVLSNLTLQGQVPLNWTTWSELGTLELADNQLTGFLTLPGEWMKLYKVNVSNNALEINLPPNIGQAVRLETLAVSGNNVGGTLPSSVGNLESLQRLDISEAGMSGTIPDLGSLSNLGTFSYFVHRCVRHDVLTHAHPRTNLQSS